MTLCTDARVYQKYLYAHANISTKSAAQKNDGIVPYYTKHGTIQKNDNY